MARLLRQGSPVGAGPGRDIPAGVARIVERCVGDPRAKQSDGGKNGGDAVRLEARYVHYADSGGYDCIARHRCARLTGRTRCRPAFQSSSPSPSIPPRAAPADIIPFIGKCAHIQPSTAWTRLAGPGFAFEYQERAVQGGVRDRPLRGARPLVTEHRAEARGLGARGQSVRWGGGGGGPHIEGPKVTAIRRRIGQIAVNPEG